eukprot:evm.model.NODE_3366_length_53577_cov_19.425985.16
MTAVRTPEAGDLPGLDALLDVILGPKLAQLYGGDTALLERIECKLGMVLDRHHPEKVETFHEMVGMTKSPIIKEKNLGVFVKSIIESLVDDASRPPVPAAKPKAPAPKAGGGGSGGASNKKHAKPAGGNDGRVTKRPKKPSSAVASAAASKSSAADSVSSLDEISRSSMSDDESAAAALPKKAPAPAPARKPAVVESFDSVMADSDGQMRGQLHLVERCPTFVYSSWRDMDHDVYLFNFPMLGAAKREAHPNGVIAFFPGFGLYKEYTDKAFRSVAMPGDQPTKLRSREEIFAFLEKGTQMRSTAKGGSGEGARRKAYVAAWQFFQQFIFKEAVCTEDPFPPLARRVPSKSKKRSSTSSTPKKPRSRAASLPAALPPLPPAAPLNLPVPMPPAASTSEEKDGAGVGALASPRPPPLTTTTVPTPPQPAAGQVAVAGPTGGKEDLGQMMGSDGAPSPLGEEVPDEMVEGREEGDAWATLPDPDDRSIRGLFSSLRWRLERLEEVWEGGDQFVWTLKSSQSNIDNLCDDLFGDPGDPEADDWKRMVGSSLDKARKKLEDKLRAMGSQGGAGATSKPAYVHGRALLDIYSDLKDAVGGFEEGMEGEVEGWDSMDFPLRGSAASMSAAGAADAAVDEEEEKEKDVVGMPLAGEGGLEAMKTGIKAEENLKADEEEEKREKEEGQMGEGTRDEEREMTPPPVTEEEGDDHEKDGSVAAELPGGSMDEEGAGISSSPNEVATTFSATPKPTDADEGHYEEEEDEEALPVPDKAVTAQEVNGDAKGQEQWKGKVAGSDS